jgi:ABC-type branched-subunit amino acid transport system substrate-binding protein
VISTGPAASINDKGMRLWQAFFEELRRLGDVEGENLAVERYSGEGRPERFADLAREVVSRNPDLIGLALSSRWPSVQPPAQYRSSPPGRILAQEWCQAWRALAAT